MPSIGLLKHALSSLMTHSLFTEKSYTLLFYVSLWYLPCYQLPSNSGVCLPLTIHIISVLGEFFSFFLSLSIELFFSTTVNYISRYLIFTDSFLSRGILIKM